MNIQLTDVLIAAGCVLALALISSSRRKQYKRPPGPKGLPVVGNLFDIPRAEEMLNKVMEWKDTYGPLTYVQTMGTSFLFINSYEAALELLERRSSKNSSRPCYTMSNELQQWEWFSAFTPYGDRWRKHSNLWHRFLSPPAMPGYAHIHTRHVHHLLNGFIKYPEQFFDHINAYFGATIMMITYGHETKPIDDPFLMLAKRGLSVLTEDITPGTYLVDVFPFLKYIPEWFPGAEFQKVAKKGLSVSRSVRFAPFELSRAEIRNRTARPSMISTLIEENTDANGNVQDEDAIASVAGTMYLAGADTTSSTIETFVLAMLLHPDIQRRGQQEILDVIGEDRLPTFDDRDSLPFVKAIIDECLRWQPVAPLGVPHMQTHDDVYNGYYIPAGTTIMPNARAMLHNPTDYPNPDVFDPYRYMPFDSNGLPKKVEKDPKRIAFGFGRRTCPGKHIGMDAVFMAVSCILATINIEKKIGKNGRPINVTPQYTQKVAYNPIQFPCAFRPRTPKIEAMIKELQDFF